MEPLLPPVGQAELEDRAFELIQKASSLGGRVPEAVKSGIGDLVRSMNCYYSNLIEGHYTHPHDIDRALKNDYSADPEKRDLQREAVAHIHVQRLIDERRDPQVAVTTIEYLTWLHGEFCRALPDELLWVKNPDTGERMRVVPGQLRDTTVAVGRHLPPRPENLNAFLQRFAEGYEPVGMSRLQQVIAVAAAHHRFTWIHPFLDGNGRVARLMSHSWFARLGVGDSLWSVARGLARKAGTYKQLLMSADEPRRNDTDGRGTLSLAALNDFCRFFLDVCIDQVEFMGTLLEPGTLLDRIQQYSEIAGQKGELPKRAFPLLRDALIRGQVERNQAAALLDVSDRQARNIVATLLEKGYLVSDAVGAPLRLGFPTAAIDSWFPKLFSEPLGEAAGVNVDATRQIQGTALSPSIVFDRVADSQVALGSASDGAQVHVWELWFANRPSMRGKETTARHLTARVQFLENDEHVAKEMVGQWAITKMPEHVGWIDLSAEIDLPAVHIWAKLLFIVQEDTLIDRVIGDGSVVSERGVYALAGENLHERPSTADHPSYFLPGTVRRARVILVAENMQEHEIIFDIERQGDGTVTNISQGDRTQRLNSAS